MTRTTPLKLTCQKNFSERHSQIAQSAIKWTGGYLRDFLPIQHIVEIEFVVNDAKAGRGSCHDTSHITINLPSNTIHGICDEDLAIYTAATVIRTLFCANHEVYEHSETPFQRIFLEGIASSHEINFLGQMDPVLYHMRKTGLIATEHECAKIYKRICAYLYAGSHQQVNEIVFDVPDFADDDVRPLGTMLGYFLVQRCISSGKADLSDFNTMRFNEIFALVPTASFETQPRE